ncbi:MAG: helix-turn-helix transcriptional regulator [Kiritimatiellae bacterium]|nr:helix-turn-helix transcriptional regulator [Kiritimatiellia bacterium]
MHEEPETTQKRSEPALVMHYARHRLPAAFPLHVWPRHPARDGSEHHRTALGCHNGLEIGYCHEGEGVFPVGSQFLHFGPRYVSVVPPMAPHGTWSRKGTSSVWTFVLTDPARLLGTPGSDYDLFDTSAFSVPGFPNLLPPADYPEIERLVEKIVQEIERRAAHYQEAVRAYFRALLVELNRVAERSHPTGTVVRQDLIARIQPALVHIQLHYGERLSVNALAALCHMSNSTFRRVFKQIMGQGPYEHLTQYRITMACLELRENRKTVEAIAWDNGFATVSCFVRKFKDVMGIAPRTWARRQEGRP